jgi:hypothetical protein
MLAKVLDALGYLHERGIYHRDIKPGNILMTKAGPVLIDFGAARQRLSERSLTVIESAGYTPFEQLQSRGKIGPWSDLYALGTTLYKTITGQTPAKATDRAFDDPEVPLAQRDDLRDRYSHELLASIDKAMSPKASDRFQDSAQWRALGWEDISRTKSVRSVPDSSDTDNRDTVDVAPVSENVPATVPPRSREDKRLGKIPPPISGHIPEPPFDAEQRKRLFAMNYSTLLSHQEEPKKIKARSEYLVLLRTLTVVVIGGLVIGGFAAFWISGEGPRQIEVDRIAAEAGNIDAQFYMGMAYQTGRGVPRDDRQALAWFEKAAKGGQKEAIQQLNSGGKFNNASSGTPELPDLIAAEAGNIDAQFRLGIAYATGRGVPRDDRQAIAWFEKAATGGHQGAVQQLNSFGKSSIALSRTPELPDLSAADAGNIDAQFRVGIAYATGRGVPRDDPQAIAWFRKAAAGGHQGAKLQLQFLEPPR